MMNRPTPKAEAHVSLKAKGELIAIVWETQDMRQLMLDECARFGFPNEYIKESVIHLRPRPTYDTSEVYLYLRGLLD